MTKKTEQKKKISRESLNRAYKVFQYIFPYKWYFIIGLILIVIGSGAFMFIPGICGEMVNVATGEGQYGFSLNQLGLALVVLVLVQAILSFIRTIALAIVSEKGMADVRNELYVQLMSQPIFFHESSRVGELTSRITADVEQLQQVFGFVIPHFLRQFITLIIGVIILVTFMPQLSKIMLMTFPIVVFIAMIFGRYIRKLSKKRQAVLADTNASVDETLQNFSIVKSFTNEFLEAKKYKSQVNEIVGVSIQFAKVRGIFFAFIITLLFGCILFILWKGATMVQAGTMEAGNLLSFVIYTAAIGGAIVGLGNQYASILSALGATDRILDILEMDKELEIRNIHVEPKLQIDGRIEFKDVKFNYPSRPDVDVLKGVTLTVKPGGKIALVGQSGSGKSTIAQLLMRFYDSLSGDILIDGNSIYNMDLINLRNLIGVVPQEVLLFGGTILENISYGKPDATKEEIISAAEKSNCMEFIDQFPEGLDTVIGERGVKLSGGQRQRVAIARAILKDPAILILDEATSSLDANSEKIVQEALDILMEGRTSIVIAHRLATIKSVDCIYVLEDGEIIEQGDHDHLINLPQGRYSQLANLQFELAH